VHDHSNDAGAPAAAVFRQVHDGPPAVGWQTGEPLAQVDPGAGNVLHGVGGVAHAHVLAPPAIAMAVHVHLVVPYVQASPASPTPTGGVHVRVAAGSVSGHAMPQTHRAAAAPPPASHVQVVVDMAALT
jgi:hypothetical protein